MSIFHECNLPVLPVFTLTSILLSVWYHCSLWTSLPPLQLLSSQVI